MSKIPILKRLATLDFAAASGLVATRDTLWLVADDGLQLQELDHAGKTRAQHLMFPGREPLPTETKARKKAKPDLEALCLLPDGRLLALGSGSRRNRMAACLFDPVNNRIRAIDAAPLYLALEQRILELNIEGASVVGDQLVLAHRGNSKGATDALVLLDLKAALADLQQGQLRAEALRSTVKIALGQLDGVALTISDLAASADDQLWFCAAAEVTDDRYDDGACAGSVVGIFNADMQPAQQWPVPGRLKIEGLAQASSPNTWLLVADADNASVPSPLLELRLP